MTRAGESGAAGQLSSRAAVGEDQVGALLDELLMVCEWFRCVLRLGWRWRIYGVRALTRAAALESDEGRAREQQDLWPYGAWQGCGAATVPYRFGQGTVGSTVTVSPLRNVSSTLPVKPPFGQVFGTVP